MATEASALRAAHRRSAGRGVERGPSLSSEAERAEEHAKAQIILDTELLWESSNAKLQANVALRRTSVVVPLEITNLRYQGVMRIVLTPLLDAPPYFGSMAFSTASEPVLDFSLVVLGGNLSSVPGLRQALRDAGVAALKKSFVWPTRALLPLRRPISLDVLRPVLDPPALDELRRAEFVEVLSPSRVQAWGSRAISRRIARLEALSEERRPRRPLSRAWEAAKGAAGGAWGRIRGLGDVLRRRRSRSSDADAEPAEPLLEPEADGDAAADVSVLAATAQLLAKRQAAAVEAAAADGLRIARAGRARGVGGLEAAQPRRSTAPPSAAELDALRAWRSGNWGKLADFAVASALVPALAASVLSAPPGVSIPPPAASRDEKAGWLRRTWRALREIRRTKKVAAPPTPRRSYDPPPPHDDGSAHL